MKRLLFCVGAFICITYSPFIMAGKGKLKEGYTAIPSPKTNPYCWTNSCAKDTHDDAQTLQNLRDLQSTQDLQSTVLVEVLLENRSELMARDTRVCEISKESDDTSNQASSALDHTNNEDPQKPTITIQNVALSQNAATIQYYLHTGNAGSGSIKTASINFNQSPTKTNLENGLIVTISALIASSNPNVTHRK